MAQPLREQSARRQVNCSSRDSRSMSEPGRGLLPFSVCAWPRMDSSIFGRPPITSPPPLHASPQRARTRP